MRSLCTAWAVVLASVAAAQSPPPAGRGPQPAPWPIAWELRFEHAPPQRILVQLPGESSPREYWYLLYRVINTSATTQHFYPLFELVTEDLRVVPTDMGVSPLVFEAIRERHREGYPELLPPSEAVGPLPAGEDYARESVAIWRATDLPGNRFTIFVGGLSGEARVVPNPAYDPAAPETIEVPDLFGQLRPVVVNPRYFTIRKTLELDYLLPGSPAQHWQIAPVLERRRWVMR